MREEELVEKFLEFLDEYYREELLRASSEQRGAISVDFSLLEKFDVELADYLLDNPEKAMALVENSLEKMDGVETKLHLRFFNLPESREIRIRNLRSKHLGKLIVVDGIVKRASEVRPEVSEVIFQCPECGTNQTLIQTERTIKQPTRCDNCGNRRGFRLISQKFYDARWIAIEEPFEITTGERPSDIMVYLKEDLTTPKMQNKTEPGNRIKTVGILKELPRRRKGVKARQMDIYLDANYVESVETEWEELVITPEDEQKILELAKDPMVYEKLIASIAPALYGLEDIKLAVALQMFGGEEHIQADKSRVRGDIHILLVGDPSCLVGDERVVLGNGAIVKIASLGFHHLQSIDAPVYLAHEGRSGVARVFHKYEFHPVIEIITESGKSIKGTFNQPLLVKEKSNLNKSTTKWKRLDEIKLGERVRTIDRIPCTIKEYVKIDWRPKFDRKRVKLPKIFEERVASILAYFLADGWVQKRRVGCAVGFKELSLLPKMERLFKDVFGITPRFFHKSKSRTVRVVLESALLADFLKTIRTKRVPDLVFRSKNSVVAAFLSWLYERDGSVSKGCLYLKAKEVELLRDVQILLLRFGVYSRICGESLVIDQADSIVKFARSVGFVSKKKKRKLGCLLGKMKTVKRCSKRWEKVVKIIYHPPETVYDIEVPVYHRFVANGIVCHNTAKSALMKVASQLIPRGKYVSGKGVTGVGLTAAVIRDEEFLGGWVLEAGALVMCNRSTLAIDEFEKVDKQDQIALHEAMELGQISIAKASIVATLPARTAILAGGNPKFGRFDPYLPIKEQIDVPETLLSRFDLKFALRDIPNIEQDTKIAEHILRARHFGEAEVKPAIEPEIFKKYVAYARKNCHPKLTPEAAEEIKKFYVDLRSKAGEGAPIPITLRQYEALIRLAEASAKIQLREEVTAEDARRAIRLMSASLRQFGFEPETGAIDIDRAEGQRATAAQRSKIRTIMSLIDDLEKTYGKEIPQDELIGKAREEGVENAEEMIRKLKQEGVLYSPKPGVISKS